jgi:outer membrane protein with beta-barrel domain
MRSVLKVFLLSATLAALSAPTLAYAEGYVSPFIGANFGNHSGNGRANTGVDAGWMSAGILGAEVDFGYSPNFFGNEGTFGSNSVTTLMGNLIVGVPAGGRRGIGVGPYATIGLGLMRSKISDPAGSSSFTDSEAAMSAGAGVMAYFSDHVGFRGDVRYLRNLQDSSAVSDFNVDFGAFHFWRASFGVVLRP